LRINARSYANGYRYCTRCRVYIKTEDFRCPNCHTLLRVSPRKNRRVRKAVDPEKYGIKIEEVIEAS